MAYGIYEKAEYIATTTTVCILLHNYIQRRSGRDENAVIIAKSLVEEWKKKNVTKPPKPIVLTDEEITDADSAKAWRDRIATKIFDEYIVRAANSSHMPTAAPTEDALQLEQAIAEVEDIVPTFHGNINQGMHITNATAYHTD